MNIKHPIDYKRPYASQYEVARQCISFWGALKEPTRNAIVMWFSDASLGQYTIERAVGISRGVLRDALLTRQMLEGSTHRDQSNKKWDANNSYKGPTGRGNSPHIMAAILALEDQKTALSAEMRRLSAEWDSIESTIQKLKG